MIQNLAEKAIHVPTVDIAGIDVGLLNIDQTSSLFFRIVMAIREHQIAKSVLCNSINGEAIAKILTRTGYRRLYRAFDVTSMDGQPAVMLSRCWKRPLPERVATTDLIHSVVRDGRDIGTKHFFLGAKREVVERAVQVLIEKYKGVEITGWRDGYFGRDDLSQIAEEIDDSEADIVWVCMGVPREQRIALELAARVKRPVLIKTGGGVLDFVSGAAPRAPSWMQSSGLEWLFRLWNEPGRLWWRYLWTTPVSLIYLLIKRKPKYGVCRLIE